MDAAEVRFSQYGFNKTTMAEIAKDCSMSAANIYRFFEGKKEIIAEMASGCLDEIEDVLRDVLRRPNVSASGKLEASILESLHKAHSLFTNRPRINEMVKYVHDERIDIINRHMEVKQSLIAEILAEGNRNGEFNVPDILFTAETILNATIMFQHPMFLNKCSLDELERAAKGITGLLLRGLIK